MLGRSLRFLGIASTFWGVNVSEKDMFEISEKSLNDDTLRPLLHMTILYAKEHGQPLGQELLGMSHQRNRGLIQHHRDT